MGFRDAYRIVATRFQIQLNTAHDARLIASPSSQRGENMALINYSECQAEISDKAAACPKWGTPVAKAPLASTSLPPEPGGAWWNVALVILGLFVVVLLVACNSGSPNDDKKMALRMAIDSCRDKQKEPVTYGERQLIAGACEELEQRYKALGDQSRPNYPPTAPPVMGRWEREALEEARKKAAQEADPVYQREQLAIIEQAKSECKPIVDQQKVAYKKLFAKGRYWDAAVLIRRCANALNEPDLKLLLADAEIRSYIADIKSSKTTPEEKLRAHDALQRDYPTEAQKFDKVASAKK